MTPQEVLDKREERVFAGVGVRENSNDQTREPLFARDNSENLRTRWQSVQGSFVDDPRKALQEADQLVVSTMKRLEEVFAEERARLESEWSKGDDVSTEDMRQSLRRYRAFFDRLLSM